MSPETVFLIGFLTGLVCGALAAAKATADALRGDDNPYPVDWPHVGGKRPPPPPPRPRPETGAIVRRG